MSSYLASTGPRARVRLASGQLVAVCFSTGWQADATPVLVLQLPKISANMSMQMLRHIGAPAVHEAQVTAVAFDQAHNLVFVASTSPNIWVWNAKSSSTQPLAIMKGHKGAVTGLVYFSGMSIIISSSLDGTCIFWDDRFKVLQAFVP